MKLGVFDSGLGGLLIARAIRSALPDVDMLYFGDTLHLPYGNRSDEAIYKYTRKAMDYLFAQDCALIVIACNTASAAALRRLQQTYLPTLKGTPYAGRNIIGVVVPTLEAAIDQKFKSIGLIATHSIVTSGVYAEELKKLNPHLSMRAQATPLLVPMIEQGGLPWIDGVLAFYLRDFCEDPVDALLLGCTHYPIIRDRISAHLPAQTQIMAQDEIIPQKLRDYLMRHPEYSDRIGRNGRSEFHVSDLTNNYLTAAQALYGHAIPVMEAKDYDT
ncbi:MAG: glutamate racemase [Alphaproteobacteria bacterium]|nr:glutamate racemase [Alphaproteobacteria bacterium]